MAPICYHSGEDVRLGDVVDVGHGHGPRARVVIIIPTGQALEGFSAREWAYLGRGVVLQDEKVFGLVHLPELDHEHLLVHRA